MDFWVSHLWAICWAINCQFYRCRQVQAISVAMGILNFEPKICRKMYKYVNLMHLFFWVERFPTYGRLSNFRHGMGGGYSVCLHHEGSMIGVQCHWWFVEDTLEHLRVHLNFFVVDGSMANWHLSQILHFGLHFKSNLKGS